VSSPDLVDIARRRCTRQRASGGRSSVRRAFPRHRSRCSTVRVESLTTASVEGVASGDRGGAPRSRVGGSLAADVIDDTLKRRATTPGRRARRVYGLAGASPRPEKRLRSRGARARPLARRSRVGTHEQKVQIALDLERATKAADARIRNVESRARRLAFGVGPLRTRSAWNRTPGARTCSASAVALADDGSGTQSGYGFVAGRTLSISTSNRFARRGHPCVRISGRSRWPGGAFR